VMTKESSPMMMTHTGNASNLQCQEVSRRKGAKELVVIWAYSVDLVWFVWFVSKGFVNELIMIIIKHLKKLDYQRACWSSPDLCLIVKCFDNQDQEPNNQINQYSKKSLISFLGRRLDRCNYTHAGEHIDSHTHLRRSLCFL
jgi:hypothetical protein